MRPPHSPIPVMGKRHWTDPLPRGVGRCRWCGKTKQLTPDHVIPRSLAPASIKHSVLNIVDACASCNSKRAAGMKPLWWCLDGRRRRMVLEAKSIVFARRYFRGVPDDERLAAAG